MKLGRIPREWHRMALNLMTADLLSRFGVGRYAMYVQAVAPAH